MDLKKEKNKIDFIKYLGLIFICLCSFIFIYKYATIKKYDDENDFKIEEFFSKKIDNNNSQNDNTDIKKETTDSKSYNYVAILEIPSISLKRGLVDINSKYNNVNYNIQIINKSTMPDIVNGNLVLASHNGASYVSFFKNLSKMQINDKIYIYYNNYKYEYSLSKIYDTPKDGNIEIYRDNTKTTITLITCKKNTKDTQVVYIGYLQNKELYQ